MIRLAVRVASKSAEIDANPKVGPGGNKYDCRVCRAKGANRTSKVCLFDRQTALVRRGGLTYRVDGELLIGLCDASARNMLEELRSWPADGREVCAVAVLHPGAREVLARESDATEYGISRALTRRELQALRTARSERCAAQNERMRPAEEGK